MYTALPSGASAESHAPPSVSSDGGAAATAAPAPFRSIGSLQPKELEAHQQPLQESYEAQYEAIKAITRREKELREKERVLEEKEKALLAREEALARKEEEIKEHEVCVIVPASNRGRKNNEFCSVWALSSWLMSLRPP